MITSQHSMSCMADFYSPQIELMLKWLKMKLYFGNILNWLPWLNRLSYIESIQWAPCTVFFVFSFLSPFYFTTCSAFISPVPMGGGVGGWREGGKEGVTMWINCAVLLLQFTHSSRLIQANSVPSQRPPSSRRSRASLQNVWILIYGVLTGVNQGQS